MKAKNGFVFRVRQAVGETQEVFAERLGVSLRSVKRFEIEDLMPTGKAANRILTAIATKYKVERGSDVETDPK